MVKKVVLILLGLLALLGGLTLAIIGTTVLALGGRSGTVGSGYHTIGTSSVALVSDPTEVRNGSNMNLSGSAATLILDGRDASEPVFVGIGPTAAVDAYLAGAGYDIVTDMDFGPFRLTTRHIDGTAQPATPVDQTFWVAKATGVSPRVSWPIADGSYRVVMMNADASPGVELNSRFRLRVPALFGVGLGTLIAGVVLGLIGLVLLIWGIRTRRRVDQVPVYGSPPGNATQYPDITPYPGNMPNPISGQHTNPGHATYPPPGLSPAAPPNPQPGLPPNQPPNQGPQG